MSIFKRLSATLSAQVDQLVGEIENHDAVIEAGIRDARRAYATAKVRLARLSRDGEILRGRIATLRAQTETWRRRAAGCDDESSGLECLRRAKRAGAEADELSRRSAEHEVTTKRLTADVDGLRRRVEALEHRRRLLRSRAASADAGARLGELSHTPAPDLDERFERWEIRIAEDEVRAEAAALVDGDAFSAAFDADEEAAALRAELAELKAEPAPKDATRVNAKEGEEHAR
jgi:phage shock protein A